MAMRELSLFTGAGGGVLGSKLLGWTTIGYVEINKYCQRVISQRIADGILDSAPIFTDVREFIQSGCAEQYKGFVDVVTAGFPCQPFSLAGKREGGNDDRNMWPETIAIIRLVRPRYAFLENVPGLLTHEYARTIFRDLAESGYNARWRVLSAAELGAPHKRDRVWIVADSNGIRSQEARAKQPAEGIIRSGKNVADSISKGLQDTTCGKLGSIQSEATEQPGRESLRRITAARDYWKTEPDVGRVVNGLANRVDRIKAIGNGQVPAVVAAAWELLSD